MSATRDEAGRLPVRWSRWATAAAVVLTGGCLCLTRPARADIIYIESGGRVVAEGELYSDRTPSADHNWLIVRDESVSPFTVSGARQARFVQVLPDTDTGGGPQVAPYIDYKVQISTPGTYRLYSRWDGNSGTSDSIYMSIVELADGLGGAADYYIDINHSAHNYSAGWDGSGGFETTSTTFTNVNVQWNIATPGVYTVRYYQREDGATLDAFVLQLSGLGAPTDLGPPRSRTVGEGVAPATAVIPTSADSFVRGGTTGGVTYSNDNYGSDTQIVLKDSGTTPDGYTRKGYIRFDLDGITPDSVVDAELSLVVSTNNATSDMRVNVFGIKEGVTGANWTEMGITWNNSPANSKTSAGGDPLTGSAGATLDAMFLGQLIIPASQTGMAVSLWDLDTLGAMLNFIKSDTDGHVDFLLTRYSSNTSWNLGFATRENPNFDPPTLTLFLAIPEPGTLVLLGAGLLALARRRRRR